MVPLNKNKHPLPVGGNAMLAQSVVGAIAGLQPHNQRVVDLAERVLGAIQQLEAVSWQSMSETRLVEQVTQVLRQKKVQLAGLREIVEPMIVKGRAELDRMLRAQIAQPA